MKDKFFIIIAILGSVLLHNCSHEKKDGKGNSDTAKTKQEAMTYLNERINEVKLVLGTHADNSWNEGAQAYGLTDVNKVFSLTNHDQNNTYHQSNDEAKNARREIYLAFEYNNPNIKIFAEIFNKIAGGGSTITPPEKKSTIENIFKNIRTYSTNYYTNTLQVLSNNKDKLDSLSADTLTQMKTKLEHIKTAKDAINRLAQEIMDAYNNDEEINTAASGLPASMKKLKTTATGGELLAYLKTKENDFKTQFDAIQNGATQMQILFTESSLTTTQP